MPWEYRIIKRTNGEETWYAIYEVYYNKKKEIYAISKNPNWPLGSNLDELEDSLKMFMKALKKPILDYNMEFSKPDWDAHA
jgi:hypothetical protein